LTTLLENSLAALAVAAQFESGRKRLTTSSRLASEAAPISLMALLKFWIECCRSATVCINDNRRWTTLLPWRLATWYVQRLSNASTILSRIVGVNDDQRPSVSARSV
jgi:hypothetical protein